MEIEIKLYPTLSYNKDEQYTLRSDYSDPTAYLILKKDDNKIVLDKAGVKDLIDALTFFNNKL